MTPTSHAAQAGIDLDLDKLEALARNRFNGGLSLTADEALALIALARNAAQAVPAADERELFEAYYQSRAKPMSYPNEYFSLVEKIVDGGNTIMVYEHYWMQKHWEVWSARAALAQQAAMCQPPTPTCQAAGAICQPAVQAVDAKRGITSLEGLTQYNLCPTGIGAEMREAKEGRYFKVADVERLLAASPAPETAQADDLVWHREALKRHRAKLEAVWEGIREAVQKYSGAPCKGEPFERLDELLSRLAASAHAQQDAAPVGMFLRTPNGFGKEEWVQVYGDDAKFIGAVELYRHAAPSAATGKATVTTINLDEVAMRRIRETYIEAFGPLPPEVMVNDIDGHICQLIADAATGKAAAANAGGLPDHSARLLAMAQSILENCAPYYDYDSNGPDYLKCRCCLGVVLNNDRKARPEQIKHDFDCAYIEAHGIVNAPPQGDATSAADEKDAALTWDDFQRFSDEYDEIRSDEGVYTLTDHDKFVIYNFAVDIFESVESDRRAAIAASQKGTEA